AAAMLLCNEQSATQNHLPLLARIAGWGLANDATHITAPSRNGSGLIRAIQKALQKAQLSPNDVEAVCGHGTGTIYSDGMELTALRTVFVDRDLPLFSVKGAIGHTFGAAGGIESALAIECLKYKIALPTIGCSQPEPNAVGLASEQVEKIPGNRILKINSG